MRIYICTQLIQTGIKNRTDPLKMKLKSIILIFAGLVFSSQLFGQVNRKYAKFMDTCAVQVISPKTIVKEAPTDSLNDFIVSCNCKPSNYKLSVFNIWGKEVIASYNISDTVGFTNLKSGDYIWLMELKYPNGKRDSKKGVISIE